MSHLSNRRINLLWAQLKSKVGTINDQDSQKILDVIKEWIQQNRLGIGSEFAKGQPVLSLLLEGKAHEFVNQKPAEAARQLKYVLSIDVKTAREAADLLESALAGFAVATEGQTCPICEEGYLGYWINPSSHKFILVCPECGWFADLQGNRPDPTAEIRPVLIHELPLTLREDLH